MWGDTANNFVKNCGSLAEDVIVAFGGLQLSTFPRPNSSDIYMDSFDDPRPNSSDINMDSFDDSIIIVSSSVFKSFISILSFFVEAIKSQIFFEHLCNVYSRKLPYIVLFMFYRKVLKVAWPHEFFKQDDELKYTFYAKHNFGIKSFTVEWMSASQDKFYGLIKEHEGSNLGED